MEENKIQIPLSQSSEMWRVDVISTEILCEHYERLFKIDVRRFFKDIPYIQIVECQKTGYRQYLPAIAGDSSFYEAMQVYDWYYPKHRWIYDEVLPFLRKTDKLLEIGCGSGHFLDYHVIGWLMWKELN